MKWFLDFKWGIQSKCLEGDHQNSSKGGNWRDHESVEKTKQTLFSIRKCSIKAIKCLSLSRQECRALLLGILLNKIPPKINGSSRRRCLSLLMLRNVDYTCRRSVHGKALIESKIFRGGDTSHDILKSL